MLCTHMVALWTVTQSQCAEWITLKMTLALFTNVAVTGIKDKCMSRLQQQRLLASSVSSPYFRLNITVFFNEQFSLAVTLYFEDSDFDLLPGKWRYWPTLIMTYPQHYFLIRGRIFISATTLNTLPFPRNIPPIYLIHFLLIPWNVTLSVITYR